MSDAYHKDVQHVAPEPSDYDENCVCKEYYMDVTLEMCNNCDAPDCPERLNMSGHDKRMLSNLS